MCNATKSCLFAGAFTFVIGMTYVLNSKGMFGAFVLTWSIIFLLVGVIADMEAKKTPKP
jgi:hypothetical protein